MFFIFLVFPDPPVGLNWTLLSMGSTGLICDVVVSWDPPPSAAENVKIGWMLLVYETQYREKGSDQWNSVSVTQRLCNHHIQISNMLLMRNTLEVKCVS